MSVMELPVDYDDLLPWERREVRMEYARLQDNQCYWCDHDLDGDPPEEITETVVNWRLFPRNFLKYPVHLQHDHDTGMTEGAVHAYCNAVMWQYHHR